MLIVFLLTIVHHGSLMIVLSTFPEITTKEMKNILLIVNKVLIKDTLG